MWKENNQEKVKEWNKQYRAMPKGKALSMWQGIIRRVGNYSKKHPTYADIKLLISKQEFLDWVIPELENWKTINGNLLNVSIDRKYENKHCQIENLQLLTKSENTRKKSNNKNVHAPEGLAWCGRCKAYLSTEKFYKCKTHYNGLSDRCKLHRS